MKKGLHLLLAVLLSYGVSGQCCSGGVPMSGNLGMSYAPQGVLQISLNYDLNVLNTFKQGSTSLNDQSRKRSTHAFLLEAGYAITDRISIDGFFSWVRQERDNILSNRPDNQTSTQGVGDLTILIKRKFWNNFLLGYGVKLPTGASDERNNNGLPLNADLQPGSGAVDQVLFFNFNQTPGVRPTTSYFITSLYRFTGKNRNYFGGSSYEFGDELQLITGISDQLYLFGVILNPSVKFRFRYAQRDQFNQNNFVSSGGEFLFINPGITWQLTQTIRYQFNAELPIYSRVNEAQLSPTYRLNTGIYFVINDQTTMP